MDRVQVEVTIHIDGGSRGNPGPAAAAYVIRAADDSTVLAEAGLYLGRATNNVAEYNGLLAGLQAAKTLGAGSVAVFSDSELLVRQMMGVYRVKNAGLKPLFDEAQEVAAEFATCSFQHVRRENNVEADALVNRALNTKSNVEDAG